MWARDSASRSIYKSHVVTCRETDPSFHSLPIMDLTCGGTNPQAVHLSESPPRSELIIYLQLEVPKIATYTQQEPAGTSSAHLLALAFLLKIYLHTPWLLLLCGQNWMEDHE